MDRIRERSDYSGEVLQFLRITNDYSWEGWESVETNSPKYLWFDTLPKQVMKNIEFVILVSWCVGFCEGDFVKASSLSARMLTLVRVLEEISTWYRWIADNFKSNSVVWDWFQPRTLLLWPGTKVGPQWENTWSFWGRNLAATYVLHLRFRGGTLAMDLPLATIEFSKTMHSYVELLLTMHSHHSDPS